MLLKNVKIQKYRCFRNYSVEFKPGVNVIIGKNGAGKSSLLHAILTLCSFMFSKDSALGDDFISSGLGTLNIRSIGESEFYYYTESRTYSSDVSLYARAVLGGVDIDWEFFRRNAKRSSLYSTKYKEAFTQAIIQSKIGDYMPVLAYYSDSFPHRNSKLMQIAVEKIGEPEIQRNFGYYQWDAENACISVWESRYCLVLQKTIALRAAIENLPEEEKQQIISENQAVLNEEKAIREAMVKFSRDLGNDFQLRYFQPILGADGTFKSLGLVFNDGRTRTFDQLPTGYRRLLAMVFDLFYRSWILNDNLHPHGIVLIDEIDLHLHPELEQNIANILSDTFPDIQFIVSSHSPLVISNLPVTDDRNQILRMTADSEQPDTITSIYGYDYDTSVESIMGVGIRSSQLRTMAESYAVLKAGGFGAQASQIHKSLMEIIHNEKRVNELIEEAKRRLEI